MRLSILFLSTLAVLTSCKKNDEIFSRDGERLPVKMNVYATDKSNLINTEFYKYDSKANKIETKIYDKNNANTSKIVFEYNSNGSLSRERYFYRQPNSSLLETHTKNYLYEKDLNNNQYLIKEEKFNLTELTNWINYHYENGKLAAKVFYVRYPQFNQTSISGKEEFGYGVSGRISWVKKFYGDNNLPSYIHDFEYSGNLVIRENITTNLFPERVEYSYNSRGQLVSKKHFEGNYLLDSETNLYDDAGLLIERIYFNVNNPVHIFTFINVFEY